MASYSNCTQLCFEKKESPYSLYPQCQDDLNYMRKFQYDLSFYYAMEPDKDGNDGDMIWCLDESVKDRVVLGI